MPLLSPSTIQAVRDLPILQVVAKHITVKKDTAPCPFHNEKTASFHIYPKTNTFKCFGCGAQGDGITFESKIQNEDFIGAVQVLAAQHGIPIEYEETALSPEQQAAEQERQQKRKDVATALEWAVAWFRSHELPAAFADRLLSDDILQLAQVGYAPAAQPIKEFLEIASKNGISLEGLMRAGLVKQSETDGSQYAAFRNRAMVPIRDVRGRVVAFTGRTFEADNKAKYLNSGDEVWTKGQHLYGLDVAAKFIQKKGFAYLVEGHLDVLQMWNHGQWNTVGGAGTALTDEQVALLARYTKHVVLVYDHDQPGRDALDKNAAKCLAAGLQVSYLIPAAPDAKGHYNSTKEGESDPDSYLRGLVAQSEKAPKKKRGVTDETTPAQRLTVAVAGWLAHKKDYLTVRALEEAKKSEALGPVAIADAIRGLGELVEFIPETTRRETYIDALVSGWKLFKKYKPKKRAEPSVKADDALAKLKEIGDKNVTANHDFGFYEKDGSYYKLHQGHPKRLASFTIQILYFVKATVTPKYVCILSDIFKRVRPAVLTTDDFVAAQAFSKALARLHGFVFEGSQDDLNNIRLKLYQGVPEAIEVERLGHSRDGYYAWANGLFYQGQFFKADKYGFVQLEHAVTDAATIYKMKTESKLKIQGERQALNAPDEIFAQISEEEVQALCTAGHVQELTYHYLPNAANIVRGQESDDDTLSKFRHYQTGTLTFAEWATRMLAAYGTDNGRVLVAFYVAALFRDLIYAENNSYFPVLFHFGMPLSGKSTAARSLAYMFGTPFNNDGINIETGSTQTGMIRMLASVANGIIWLNEYKNTIDRKMLGTIKGIADGSGKTLGMATAGNETKVTAPRSAAMLGGQDLPTADPAIMQRCIVNEYDGRNHETLGKAQKELQELEQDGHCTAVTCEVLGHRPVLETGYRFAARSCTADLVAAGEKAIGTRPDSRAVLNLASILTPVKMLLDAQALAFPFTYAELLGTLTGKMVQGTEFNEESGDVEVYLQTIAGLPANVLQYGYHYHITKESNNKQVLFLRTTEVHGLYLEAAGRQRFTPLSVGTMRNYLKKHSSFIDVRKHAYFPDQQTNFSAVALDYYMLRETHGIYFRTEATAPHDKRPDPPTPTRNVEEEVCTWVGTLPLDAETPQLRGTFLELFQAFNEWKGMEYANDAEFRKALRVGSRLDTPKGLRIVTQVTDGETNCYVVSVAADPF